MRDIPKKALERVRKHQEIFARALDSLVPNGPFDTTEDLRMERYRGARHIVELVGRLLPFTEEPEGISAARLRSLLGRAGVLAKELSNIVLEISEPLGLCADDLFGRKDLTDDPPIRTLLSRSAILGAHAKAELNNSACLTMLVALEQFCSAATPHVPLNAGGSRTLYNLYFGSAKRRLVKEAAYVFARSWGKKMTASVGGPFYNFAAAVYELVAEKSAEDTDVGLKRYVETAVPLLRELFDVSDELARCDRQLQTPAMVEKVRQLRLRQREIDQQLTRGPSRAP